MTFTITIDNRRYVVGEPKEPITDKTLSEFKRDCPPLNYETLVSEYIKLVSPFKVGDSIDIECQCPIELHGVSTDTRIRTHFIYCKGDQSKKILSIKLKQANYLIDKISTEKFVKLLADLKMSNIDYVLLGQLE